MMDKDIRIKDVLKTVRELQNEEIGSIGALVDRLGAASFMPLLLIISLIIVTPLSAIPGLSSLCGAAIALISGQLLFGRRTLWLPEWIKRFEIPKQRLTTAFQKMETPLVKLQNLTRERLTFLAKGPFAKLLLGFCMVAGLSMPLLEFIPTSSSLLAAVVALLTVALMARDGVFVVAGLSALAIAVLVLITLWQSVLSIL